MLSGQISNLKKTVYYLKRNGWKATWNAVAERLSGSRGEAYQYVCPAAEELERQRQECQFSGRPLISIIVPAYGTPIPYFRELIDSVTAQTYGNWELILADASVDNSLEKVAAGYGDDRIRYVRLPENGGISMNSNAALSYAKGAYVGLLDHDDLLTPDALYEMTEQISASKEKGIEPCFLYSDEDKCDGDANEYYDPNLKEDFNPDLFLSNNYICHFLMMKTDWIKELRFRKEYDGAQDYDLILRAAKKAFECYGGYESIVHVPKVLYHWRCHRASTAENPQSKRYAYEAGRRALQDYVCAKGIQAEVEHLPHLGFYRVEYGSDIFAKRPDLGAVGGCILKGGKRIGGRMDESGKVYYEGLPAGFSGPMHRAVLTQNADCVDLRAIKVRKELEEVFAKTVGVPYLEDPQTGLFDSSTLSEKTDINGLSRAFGKAVREEGFLILWDPKLCRHL